VSTTQGTEDRDRFAELPSGIRLCYRVDGPDDGEPLLLIAGLAIDLTSWPQRMVDGFVERGFRVIRFDNRDVGRSTFVDAPPPSRVQQLLAKPRPDAYDLGDMATDALGLLDALGVRKVHLVGMSMGGMIAQTLAARHPERVLTLTSIFSTTGHRRVGRPARSTVLRIAQPPARTREESVTRHLAMLAHIGSATFPPDDAEERAWAAAAWDRCEDPRRSRGVARQIQAIQASGDRTAELARISAPTLVVHGDTDRMVHPSGGRATAEAVPGARHVEISGMAHHIAPGVVDRLVDLASAHARGEDLPAPAAAPAAGGLDGTVAAVTGAASGIGRALALELARRGARLALSDVDELGLAETADQVKALGAEVHTARVDVADRTAVVAWADEVAAHFGVVHQVYNNAGIAGAGGTVLESDWSVYDRVLSVNLLGVINGTKAFLPHLVASGDGHVVNVSSLNGFLAQPALSAYVTSKFGVRGFTETVRAEMLAAGLPVRVSVVHPGGVRTGIADAALAEARAQGLEITPEQEARRRLYNEKLLRMPAEEAARIVVDGVQAGRPRILVGRDARLADRLVRLLPGHYPALVARIARRLGT
jgi:NAD(P)-dependent dehydrogenase (short-subunit alcohol dehydrogenase family)/pimeloyl-ACP methyl ester carboxylesterase